MKSHPKNIGRYEFYGSIIYNAARSIYYKFDRQATTILEQGTRMGLEKVDVSQVASGIKQKDFRNFLKKVRELGLMTKEGRFDGKFIKNEVLVDKLSAPLKIFLDVTNECNSFCKHCYVSAGQKLKNELTWAELKRLVDEMATLGIFQIALAGGEPLIRKDIFRFIRHLRDHQIDISITTNGSLITEEVAKILGNLKLKTITVSVDGATKETYELVRGKGLFDKVIQGIKHLKKYCTSKTAMRTTLMKTNIHEIPQLFKLAERLGCDVLKLNAINPFGRALEHKELFLTKEEYKEAIKTAILLAEKSSCKVELPIEKYQVDKINFKQLMSCVFGQETCNVLANGDVVPCPFSYGKFLFGNIKKDSLRQAWKNGLNFTLNNPICSSCKARGGKGKKRKGYVKAYLKDIVSL